MLQRNLMVGCRGERKTCQAVEILVSITRITSLSSRVRWKSQARFCRRGGRGHPAIDSLSKKAEGRR